VQEAARRGLSNLRNTVDCMPAYIDKKNIDLFTKHAILTEAEMRARYEIHLENYCKVSAIEANTLLDMAMRGVLPAMARYSGDLASGMAHKQRADLSGFCRVEDYLIRQLSLTGGRLLDVCQELSTVLEKAPSADSGIDAARYYRDEVGTRTQQASELISHLESLVDAKVWPYPTYADILFSV
jgi:glutamine synthetase